jgi:4,5:9,10-diseco-3-hydroxy-5,9,17-trioxoandrosta-1(10),2-diene-4-oate hydrolase
VKKGNNRQADPVESLKIKIGNHQVHYLKAGSGAPVVLLHGGASDSRDWTVAMAALSHRYTLYAPDIIGYGLSDRAQSGYYFSDFVEFIRDFNREMGLDSPVLVGHSFGGSLCLQYALSYPEKVQKLVIIDSAGIGRTSRLGTLMFYSFWAARKLLMLPQPNPRFLRSDNGDADWFFLDRLSGIKAPTLIVWKRYDPYLPLSLACKAKETIPGAALAVLPGYGHAPHKQNGEDFNRLLLDFLDGG